MAAPSGVKWDGVLVRFGEIGIKSAPVRRAMTNRLRGNILDAMVRAGVAGDALPAGSRLWLAGPDPEALALVATRVFGVVSASPAVRVAATMEAMQAAATRVALAAPSPWSSFAVRATREGQHPFTSQDMGIQVGSAIFRAAEAEGRKPNVDLGAPELEVHVEVRQGNAFVYTEKRAGPGGLPVGTQGKVVGLLSDLPSMVAAWLMMRRGCQVVALHVGTTGSLPAEAVAKLAQWGLPREVTVMPACSGSVAKEVLLQAAAAHARKAQALAVMTGDTLASDLRTPGGLVVLRPVCGLEPSEVERIARLCGLEGLDYPDSILADDARETVESLASMRRVVSA